MQKTEHVDGAATSPCACPRQHSGLAPSHVLGLLGALSLAMACGGSDRSNVSRPAPEDDDIFDCFLGQDSRVTHTGGSEASLILIKPNPTNPASSPTQRLTACGDIHDVLPDPGTGEYFVVVNGGLQHGTLDKGAPRTPIAIDPPIRINRLLALEKSSDRSVLLVEEVSASADKRGAIWRLAVARKNLRATASRAPELQRDHARYRRDFYNVRCKRDDEECLRIGFDAGGNPVLDIEPRPNVPRRLYLPLSTLLAPYRVTAPHRAMFHPDIPDAILLIASCGKE